MIHCICWDQISYTIKERVHTNWKATILKNKIAILWRGQDRAIPLEYLREYLNVLGNIWMSLNIWRGAAADQTRRSSSHTYLMLYGMSLSSVHISSDRQALLSNVLIDGNRVPSISDSRLRYTSSWKTTRNIVTLFLTVMGEQRGTYITLQWNSLLIPNKDYQRGHLEVYQSFSGDVPSGTYILTINFRGRCHRASMQINDN